MPTHEDEYHGEPNEYTPEELAERARVEAEIRAEADHLTEIARGLKLMAPTPTEADESWTDRMRALYETAPTDIEGHVYAPNPDRPRSPIKHCTRTIEHLEHDWIASRATYRCPGTPTRIRMRVTNGSLEWLRDRHARIAALQAEETNRANAELFDLLQRDYADRILRIERGED